MKKWVTKTWFPLLLLALFAAQYLEFGSIRTIDLDTEHNVNAITGPKEIPVTRLAEPTTQKKIDQAVSRLAVGQHYASLTVLVADQLVAGYLKTGYFGNDWPATVSEITSDNDGIVFTKRDGSRHTYSGFNGYRMKMVRLNGGGDREIIVVFRSVEKQ